MPFLQFVASFPGTGGINTAPTVIRTASVYGLRKDYCAPGLVQRDTNNPGLLPVKTETAVCRTDHVK